MKYSILIIAALAFSLSVNAQTNKQVAGSNSLEVQFSPLNGNPISLDGGIRFRTFSTETTAFRGTVFLGGGSTSDKFLGQNTAGDDVDLVDKTSQFSIQLRPGMEWHLVGTDKLSPYYGGEAVVGYSTNSSTSEFLVGDDVEDQKTSTGMLSLGVNAVGGFDYYFAQNIFLGAEIGAGILYQSEGNTTTTSSLDGVDDTETPGGSALTGGPNVNARIRLGIIF